MLMRARCRGKENRGQTTSSHCDNLGVIRRRGLLRRIDGAVEWREAGLNRRRPKGAGQCPGEAKRAAAHGPDRPPGRAGCPRVEKRRSGHPWSVGAVGPGSLKER